MSPEERLVVYGAGHVAVPTVAIAAKLGFAVEVVDERDELATPERFPDARLVVSDPRRHARALDADARTWILVVTHDHQLDQDLVETLLPRPFAWMGMIGSKAKVSRFFVRLRAAGMDEALFARLCAPVGVDLGAETPEEIAVSIAAELVRVRRGRAGPMHTLSDVPLPARGGDGVAHPPRLETT